MRITLLCSRRSGATNAIEDASVELVRALRAAGADADLALYCRGGSWISPDERPIDIDSTARAGDWLVVQYQPFLWGRRGFAPWLPFFISRLRRRHGARVALIVHEPYLDFGGPAQSALAIWQRAQLAALRLPADLVCASIEPWTNMLARAHPRRPTSHLPVGSNLPDCSGDRADARRELAPVDDTFVLAVFGTDHPARLWSYADAALEHIAARRRTLVLSLGAGNPFPSSPPHDVTVHRPGLLPAADVGRLLAAADLLLAPFVDGVSSRRGSIMAALQHSVAVVGTDGHLTDTTMRTAECPVLTPVGNPRAFASAAEQLATDDARRAEIACAGRRLYEREYAWARVAAKLLGLLESNS